MQHQRNKVNQAKTESLNKVVPPFSMRLLNGQIKIDPKDIHAVAN